MEVFRLDRLRSWFDSHPDAARLLALLSPT
jgi:hypothetical protein